MVVVQVDQAELKHNNIKSLKLRKELFRQHLISLFALGGYAFIIILYLKDTSFLRFAGRFALHSIISKPFPSSATQQMTTTIKKNIIRSLFISVIAINLTFLLIDLIAGIPSGEDDTSNFLYGSITLEIIGETKPASRLSYVYYNLLIFCFQYVLIYLSTILNINEEVNQNNNILPGASYSINQIEGDGYTGVAKVASISPVSIYNEIQSYSITRDETEEDATYGYISSRLDFPGMI